jgi:hypothetical protein
MDHEHGLTIRAGAFDASLDQRRAHPKSTGIETDRQHPNPGRLDVGGLKRPDHEVLSG